MSFARGANPIWFFNNLTGMIFDDTYYAFFLYNVAPYNPQNVYQTPSGTPWGSPIQYLASGGLPDNIYGDPNGFYRIEVRQGPLSSSPLVYLIQNYVFGDGAGSATVITDPLLVSENLITNPQFADTFFGTSVTIATAGTYPIAPGWNLVLTGTGSTTITQGTNPGSSGIVPNPAYYLQFTSSGWTSAVLEQTFANNGAIFDKGAVAVAFSANTVGSNFNLTVSYVPSGTPNTTPIHIFIVTPGGFNTYKWASNIPASMNAGTGPTATVQLQFSLPTNGTLSLSNIQFTGQSTNLSTGLAANPGTLSPTYNELSYERMVDHEFNVYRNSIVYQPKNSLLVGWNFALNPWQFTTTTVTNVATNQYTADQTIIIQQAYVASATGNNVAVGQASLANDYGLQVTAVTANNQFAILQYIAPQTIRQSWGKKVSALVRMALTTTHGTTPVQIKMRLIYKAGLPGTISQTEPVSSWTVGQDPTSYAAGWTAIIPPNDPVYTLTSTPTSFSFNGFILPSSTNASMTLGILVYTLGGLNQTATADFVVFNDVSLVENDFAMATQRQTVDDVLRECQYYYEKSYNSAVPGNTETTSFLTFTQSLATSTMYPSAFTVFFKTSKAITPTIKVYSPASGTVNVVDAVSIGSSGAIYDTPVSASYSISNYSISGGVGATGLGAVAFVPINGASHPAAGPNNAVGSVSTSLINLHYSANACLGNPTLP